MVLVFEKPPRAMSVERWKGISADGAPPGVYVPNMSTEDAKKWRAKIVGTKSGNHQVEVRSSAPGCNIVIIVNGKMPNPPTNTSPWARRDFTPFEVKVSANGPYFSPEVQDQFNTAIAEAKKILEKLDSGSTKDEALQE